MTLRHLITAAILILGPGVTHATTLLYNAADEFIAGPTAQSATNQWQYFQGNETRSVMTLLGDWDTNGNEVFSTDPQWDQNGGPNPNFNYPFVQKTSPGPASGNFGATISGDALIIHPGWQGDGVDTVVAVGWYNNTGYTVSLDFSAIFTLEEGQNSNGIEYFVQRGLAGDGRFLSLTNSILAGGTQDAWAIASATGIELLAGEMLYVGIDNNGSYEWDHTRLDLDISATFDDSPSAVPMPAPLALLGLGLVALRRFRKG
ncbi:MAG: hypothetical protein H6981_11700 [Gammaproteobacteria bacterium]|nr:hypothetical protein [Gammaproteobacteria bacterium]MCP5137452.1 hypothetical protein [Gammaproteobacteria bacterium]